MKHIKSEQIESGLAFHEFHDTLITFCCSYDRRVKVIQDTKPISEQELRLRLFQIIPPNRLPGLLIEPLTAYRKAEKACEKAWKAYEKACVSSMPELIRLHDELCPNCPWDGHTIFAAKEEKC